MKSSEKGWTNGFTPLASVSTTACVSWKPMPGRKMSTSPPAKKKSPNCVPPAFSASTVWGAPQR